MPTLKRINREAGTNFRRTTELVEALRPKGEPVQHYQIRATEYGQVCLRAPNDHKIVGMLWRVNEHGGRSGGGHFGQAVLFPAQMRPGQNSDIDYRIPNDSADYDYFTAKLPEITEEWQWIDAHPSVERESFWYGMEGVYQLPVSEYDTWLLTGEPMPGTVPEEAPDLVAQEEARIAQEEEWARQIEEENRRHDEQMERERLEAEDQAIKDAQDREDERLRREQEEAEAEYQRQQEVDKGIVEYTLLDQMRDGFKDTSDGEVKAWIESVLSYGGEYEEAARAYAAERGITL